MCRQALLNNPVFNNAFVTEPGDIAHWTAQGINLPGNQEPFGFCAKINKVAVRRDDIEMIPFFYRY